MRLPGIPLGEEQDEGFFIAPRVVHLWRLREVEIHVESWIRCGARMVERNPALHVALLGLGQLTVECKAASMILLPGFVEDGLLPLLASNATARHGMVGSPAAELSNRVLRARISRTACLGPVIPDRSRNDEAVLVVVRLASVLRRLAPLPVVVPVGRYSRLPVLELREGRVVLPERHRVQPLDRDDLHLDLQEVLGAVRGVLDSDRVEVLVSDVGPAADDEWVRRCCRVPEGLGHFLEQRVPTDA